MRFTRALIPTLKEAPSDASNVSQALLIRGGFIRRVGAGIYDFLPLGLRVLQKVGNIVRREMNESLAEEILMPIVLPAEYFQETGRWDVYGDTLFRLKDRKGGDFHLGPTHEEIVTDIARREIHSYRDVPKTLYQIQTKFRDEPRPRGGLLRCREFVMKDAYSFDSSEEGARASYEEMRKAYHRIFDSMGLRYRMVAADSGAIGGNTSAEFQVLVDSGEDAIVACGTCDYAANVEVAEVRASKVATGDEAPLAIETVDTPKQKSIDEVSAFLKVDKRKTLKSLLYLGGTEVALVVVRGDHDVNEVKLAKIMGASEVHLAADAEVFRATGAPVGSVGPQGFKGKVWVDRAASEVVNAVAGANKKDQHVRNLQYGRDYTGEVVDLRLAGSGDGCPKCEGTLTSYKGIEAGHIFILGTHYSGKMNANFLSESGERKPLVMGCYGIGVSRLVATAIEQNHDENGMRWPMAIAPYQVHLCSIGTDEAVNVAAEKIYKDLRAAGVEVVWDDRDERPGVKFKDADLIGIPVRLVVGGKGLAAGNVEMKLRHDPDPKKITMMPLDGITSAIVKLVRELGGAVAS